MSTEFPISADALARLDAPGLAAFRALHGSGRADDDAYAAAIQLSEQKLVRLGVNGTLLPCDDTDAQFRELLNAAPELLGVYLDSDDASGRSQAFQARRLEVRLAMVNRRVNGTPRTTTTADVAVADRKAKAAAAAEQLAGLEPLPESASDAERYARVDQRMVLLRARLNGEDQ